MSAYEQEASRSRAPRRRRGRVLCLLLAGMVLSLVAVGCGSDDDEAASSGAADSAENKDAPEQASFSSAIPRSIPRRCPRSSPSSRGCSRSTG